MKRPNHPEEGQEGKEVEPRFRDDEFVKSGWCGNRPKCVTVARNKHGVAVRDTKDKSKKTLVFTHGEWSAFLQGVRSGEFDV